MQCGRRRPRLLRLDSVTRRKCGPCYGMSVSEFLLLLRLAERRTVLWHSGHYAFLSMRASQLNLEIDRNPTALSEHTIVIVVVIL